jgi:hypothetical protein
MNKQGFPAAGAGPGPGTGPGTGTGTGTGTVAVAGTKKECQGIMGQILDKIRGNFNSVKENLIGTDKETNKKETDKQIKARIKVYASKQENSKGYSINGYKVDVENEEYPFSTADEVNYFLENLIQKTENDILKPDNKDNKDNKTKQDPNIFFKFHKVSIPIFPIKIKDQKTGGKKKTIKRNRKKHRKSKKNKQK